MCHLNYLQQSGIPRSSYRSLRFMVIFHLFLWTRCCATHVDFLSQNSFHSKCIPGPGGLLLSGCRTTVTANPLPGTSNPQVTNCKLYICMHTLIGCLFSKITKGLPQSQYRSCISLHDINSHQPLQRYMHLLSCLSWLF